MRAYCKRLCLVAALWASGLACAQQWFAVAGPDTEAARTLVEVDLDSVRSRGQVGEAIIRVTYDALRQHATGFGFRSFVASAQFDCQRRRISLISAAYFSLPRGDGHRVGADSSGRDAGMPESLVRSMPMAALQALLKATCATTTQTP
jgi:hypothetical protein